MVLTSQTTGELVRLWRRHRGLSQLRLALEAGVSSRHLSFVETGRAHPSRSLLLRLGQTLQMPLREQNTLLQSAGLAAVYGESALDESASGAARAVVRRLLQQFEPFSAAALDRHWNIVMHNAAFGRFRDEVVSGGHLSGTVARNMLRLALHPDGMRRCIVNFDDVARELLRRCYRETMAARDGSLANLLAEVVDYPGIGESWRRLDGWDPTTPFLIIHVRQGDVERRVLSTTTTLGTPFDATLQELRIETFFPIEEVFG